MSWYFFLSLAPVLLASHGSTAFQRTSTIASNTKFLAKSLDFPEAKLRKLQKRAMKGNVLTLESGVLEERVDWLSRRLNLEAKDIKRIAQSRPNILEMRSKESLGPKIQYLESRLQLDEKSLRRLILHAPAVLGLSLENNIVPKLEYLVSRLSLDGKQLQKLVLAVPTMLTCNLAPKLDHLQSRLRLDVKSLRRLILVAPSVLTISTEGNIKPKLDYLQRRLMQDEESLQRLVTRVPTVLNMRLEETIVPKIDWLQQRLDLDDTAISCIIRQHPKILGYSIPNRVEPTLVWLETNLRLTENGLSHLLQTVPSMLCLKVDCNLGPTLNLCIDVLGDKESALNLLAHYPSLFSFDLGRRKMPRLKKTVDAWARRSGYNPPILSLRDLSFRKKVDEFVTASMDLAKLDDAMKSHHDKSHSTPPGDIDARNTHGNALGKVWEIRIDEEASRAFFVDHNKAAMI